MIMNVGFGICNDVPIQTHDYYRVTNNAAEKRLSRLLTVISVGVFLGALMALLPHHKVAETNAEQMSSQGTLRNLAIFDLKIIQQEVESDEIHSLGQDGQEEIDANNEDDINSEEVIEQAPRYDADAFASENFDENKTYNNFDQDVVDDAEQQQQEEEQHKQQNEPAQQQSDLEQQVYQLQQQDQQHLNIDESLLQYSPPEPVSRLDCLDPAAHYNFVHVYLCAGTSWMQELQAVLNPNALFPRSANAELGEYHTVPYMQERYNSHYTMLSLRSPRRKYSSLHVDKMW